MSRYGELKRDVLEAAKRAHSMRLFAGTSGNLSVFRDGVVAVTPSGIRYDGMTADDIVVLLPGGEIVEGTHAPSSETPMHLALYAGRSDIRAVVHTHSPYATAFAAGGRPVPAALIETVLHLGGEVRVAPPELPGTKEVGVGALNALTGRFACLLGNHGAVAVGGTMEEALLRAEYVEDAAKICAIALSTGGVLDLPAEIVSALQPE
ncbi:class II aldolase/adducin family protein [Oscillospiraceae bacterium OttesenSCG-928-G22]|nr:class II aldolase/adducin family protein [Oscillospiraceae bacterium OttesenSCG-928-G22]